MTISVAEPEVAPIEQMNGKSDLKPLEKAIPTPLNHEINTEPVNSKPLENGFPKPSPPHEEHQYLNLIHEILENGEHHPDR